MSCCVARRQPFAGHPKLGLVPLVPFLGEMPADTASTTSPATGGLGFGKAVLAGVTIYGVTRMIDSIFGGGSRK